jgi:hypothetical protein
VLLIGAFILFSYFPVNDQRGFFGMKRVADESVLQSGGTVLSIRDVKSERVGPRVCVEGRGKNIGETTLGYVRTIVVFLNANGDAFDFSSGDAQTAGRIVRPGETFSFARCAEDAKQEIDKDHYKLFFEGKVGTEYQNKKLEFIQL